MQAKRRAGADQLHARRARRQPAWHHQGRGQAVHDTQRRHHRDDAPAAAGSGATNVSKYAKRPAITGTAITFPFLEDFTEIFGLLMGEDANLVRLDLGTLQRQRRCRAQVRPVHGRPRAGRHRGVVQHRLRRPPGARLRHARHPQPADQRARQGRPDRHARRPLRRGPRRGRQRRARDDADRDRPGRGRGLGADLPRRSLRRRHADAGRRPQRPRRRRQAALLRDHARAAPPACSTSAAPWTSSSASSSRSTSSSRRCATTSSCGA